MNRDDKKKKAFEKALEYFRKRGTKLSERDVKFIETLIEIELVIEEEKLKRI